MNIVEKALLKRIISYCVGAIVGSVLTYNFVGIKGILISLVFHFIFIMVWLIFYYASDFFPSYIILDDFFNNYTIIENNNKYTVYFCAELELWKRYKTNIIHRENKPARILRDEQNYQIEYFNEDKLHRENGPARLTPNRREYWINYKLHREDGPAVVRRNGEKEYWLDNIYYPNINSVDELIIASIIE